MTMVDLLYYSAPLLVVGGIASLIYPDQSAAVLAAQAAFIAIEAIGYVVGATFRRRNGGNA
jgi:hypothetical protein